MSIQNAVRTFKTSPCETTSLHKLRTAVHPPPIESRKSFQSVISHFIWTVQSISSLVITIFPEPRSLISHHKVLRSHKTDAAHPLDGMVLWLRRCQFTSSISQPSFLINETSLAKSFAVVRFQTNPTISPLTRTHNNTTAAQERSKNNSTSATTAQQQQHRNSNNGHVMTMVRHSSGADFVSSQVPVMVG